jgi:probable DNA metabolism protein
MMVYIFDGSLEGLLTAIFEYYDRKPQAVKLTTQQYYQPEAFGDSLMVESDEVKAGRVWAGLKKKLPADWLRKFYCAYLSEQPETFFDLFEFARYIFDSSPGAAYNFGNPFVLAIADIDKKVHREKHRMEAFIRFRKTGDGLFFATIEPDFNVLPLIVNHFKNRYTDQQWVIYDLKRKCGIFYDMQEVHEVTFDFLNEITENKVILPPSLLDGHEELYSVLWRDYFKSTNIPARKNMKLHIRHVPKRYWKYLTEKLD